MVTDGTGMLVGVNHRDGPTLPGYTGRSAAKRSRKEWKPHMSHLKRIAFRIVLCIGVCLSGQPLTAQNSGPPPAYPSGPLNIVFRGSIKPSVRGCPRPLKSAEGNLVGVRPPPGTNRINDLPDQRIFGCVFLCPNCAQTVTGAKYTLGDLSSQRISQMGEVPGIWFPLT
jgi:hypothetical protein